MCYCPFRRTIPLMPYWLNILFQVGVSPSQWLDARVIETVLALASVSGLMVRMERRFNQVESRCVGLKNEIKRNRELTRRLAMAMFPGRQGQALVIAADAETEEGDE